MVATAPLASEAEKTRVDRVEVRIFFCFFFVDISGMR